MFVAVFLVAEDLHPTDTADMLSLMFASTRFHK
jgi:hypothetical protein